MISPEMHQEMEGMMPANPVGARIMKWVRSALRALAQRETEKP